MITDHTRLRELHELPPHWQEQIRKLRSENRELRSRLTGRGLRVSTALEELPQSWQSKIRELRDKSAKLRTQRNEARAEADQLRAELVARNGD